MEPSWVEHIDLVQVIFGAVILLVGWFAVRTLKQIDRNQADTAASLAALSKEFYKLQGQHEALMCQHKGDD